MPATLNLTNEPETIDFPATHYVFVERVGNIPLNAPQAWQIVQKLAPELLAHNQIIGAAALYKPGKGIYRAGFMPLARSQHPCVGNRQRKEDRPARRFQH